MAVPPSRTALPLPSPPTAPTTLRLSKPFLDWLTSLTKWARDLVQALRLDFDARMASEEFITGSMLFSDLQISRIANQPS